MPQLTRDGTFLKQQCNNKINMVIKKKIVFALLFIVFFIGCKKYPDGPLADTYKLEKKIAGLWAIENLKVNGIDSTSNIKYDSCHYDYPVVFFLDDHRGDYEKALGLACNGFKGKNTYWEVTNRKRYLTLRYVYYKNSNELYPIILNVDATINWKIMRFVEKKQLWLKSNINNKEYYIKLIKDPA